MANTFVLWLTGLSAAGKTTVGREIYSRLKSTNPALVLLDGDAFRTIMGDDLGHDPADRLANAYRLARMCAYLSGQGISVICCTMSLYPEIWEWNRANISGYFEVYLKVNKETLITRDIKGLYRRADAGLEKNIVGIDLPFDEPRTPDLVVDNTQNSAEQLEGVVNQIIQGIVVKFGIAVPPTVLDRGNQI